MIPWRSARQCRALLCKLAEARAAVQPVEKKGHNSDEGYDYVEAVDVVEEANRVLTTRGILVLPSIEAVEQTYGKTGVLVKAELAFEVVDVDTGFALVKRWFGYGFDFPGDKAIYQATTGAAKYFLAGLLAIPFVGRDPEKDRDADTAVSLEAERRRREQDAAATAPDPEPGEVAASA